MSYLAQGINSGWQAGASMVAEKKRREQRDKELTQRALEASANRDLQRELHSAGLAADAPLKAAQANRINALAPGELGESHARARQTNATAQRTETLTPLEADDMRATTRGRNALAGRTELLTDLEADQMRAATAGRNADVENARLVMDAHRLKLEEARRALEGGPTAEVTQKFGDDGTIKTRVPVAEAQRRAAEMQYRSPYAEKIAQLGDSLATNQAEIDSGDTRTGFLNLKSRKDEVSRAQSQRVRLQALELQDMVNKGVISPEEGDRRAAALLKRNAPALR